MMMVLLAVQAVSPPDLSWLAGDWVQCAPGPVVEERWLGPAGGVMVGANLTRGKRGPTYEFFRIAPAADGRWSYHAQPGGRQPVLFALVEQAPGRAVFENKAHDFPQRVLYWRHGANLHARVEGVVNGKLEGEQWSLTPARSPTAPCG